MTNFICDEENTHYEIPSGITEIEKGIFSGCRELILVIIPNSVRIIGDGSFYECRNLQEIIIPNSVTIIGDGSFYYCSSLESIIIPSSVTSIGEQAFYECSSLKSIIIPSSVTSIRSNAFYGCRNIKLINYEGNSDPGATSSDVLSVKNIQVKVPPSYKSRKFCGLPISGPCKTIQQNHQGIHGSVFRLSRLITMMLFSWIRRKIIDAWNQTKAFSKKII